MSGMRASAVAGVLLAASGGVAAAGLGNLDLGRIVGIASKAVQASSEVSEPQEIGIGDGIAARLLGAAPLLEDEPLQRYVNRVGRWVVLQSERPDLPWRFGVLDTETINAFAVPGGCVFVTRGLLAQLRSEDELAGVLGHEAIHVVRRHHLEAIRKKAGVEMVADVAGMMLERRNAYLGKLVSAGMDIYKTGLDRDDEYQADRLGVVLAARAGYGPWGLPHVLSALERLKGDAPDLAFLVRTHPPFSERLARLRSSMAGRLDRFAGQAERRERFLAMQQRLR